LSKTYGLTGSGAVCAQALFSPNNIAATDTISHAALVIKARPLKPNMVTSLCVREDTGKVGKEIAPSVEHLFDVTPFAKVNIPDATSSCQ
jgi:hypothetical protein